MSCKEKHYKIEIDLQKYIFFKELFKMTKFPLDKTLPKNIPLLIKQRAKENADVYLQASKNKKGEFDYYTYKQVYDIVIQLALALRKIGVKRGSNVALISDNRKEWLWTDLAILSLGAADVPRGCDSMGNEIRFIINFADCEIGFFENARQLEKVLENIKEVPNLKQAYIFDDVDDCCADGHGPATVGLPWC